MELWELVARERIRDSLARYNWSGDAFRLAELANAFCEDGVLAIRGREPVQGRAAIVELLGGGAGQDDDARRAARKETTDGPTIVRHNVTNVRFVDVTPQEVRVDSYFTVLTDIGLDHYGRYRDTFVPVGAEWLIRLRAVSSDWHAPNSMMSIDDLGGT